MKYQVTTCWTGNLGTGTSEYHAYSRNHEIANATKSAPILATYFRGDPSRYNPEELLVGAISACHMLWVLHLCSDAGIVVTEYSDQAVGEMVADKFTLVTLYPRITITEPARNGELIAIHHKAHEVCALARSVNFPVIVKNPGQ